MPDYCTLGDVNTYVPQQPFTVDSVPTGANVAQFISDIAQEMDMVLQGLGYIVPVTQDEAVLNQLRRANAWGALGVAQDARAAAIYRDDSAGGAKSVWTQRYEAFKKALQDPKNPYELKGALRTDLEVVKPVGTLQSSTVNTPGLSDYRDNPPFSIGMKL